MRRCKASRDPRSLELPTPRCGATPSNVTVEDGRHRHTVSAGHGGRHAEMTPPDPQLGQHPPPECFFQETLMDLC